MSTAGSQLAQRKVSPSHSQWNVWEFCSRVTPEVSPSTACTAAVSTPPAPPSSPESSPCYPGVRPADHAPQLHGLLVCVAGLQATCSVCRPLQSILESAVVNFASWCVVFSNLPCENEGEFQKSILRQLSRKEEPHVASVLWVFGVGVRSGSLLCPSTSSICLFIRLSNPYTIIGIPQHPEVNVAPSHWGPNK